jgi:hypothetical protein
MVRDELSFLAGSLWGTLEIWKRRESMKIAFRVLAVSMFVVVAAIPQPTPAGTVSVAEPTCVTCLNPSNSAEGCTANYGVSCMPNEEFDHCTDAQAAAWCPGWSSQPPNPTPDCAICYASGESGGGACYANYGAQCNPVAGLSQCTNEQAKAWCAGWAQKMATLNLATPDE